MAEDMQEKQEDTSLSVLKMSGMTDIHYEAPEEFGKSVLREAYEKAFRITEEIVKCTEKPGFDVGEGKGTQLRNKEQIYNIIFFTGERGTGKTSAMLSYMEFLKDYYRNSQKKGNEEKLGTLKFDKGEYMFTGLEYIDASSLDRKEDILGNVLAKMLKKLNDEEGRKRGGIVQGGDYEYKRRQIRMQFNDVYERLKDQRSEQDLMQTDSDLFLETLERLSLTWNVKQSFQTLLKSYLDIMVYQGSGEIKGENHFLVIPIDDLDMNIKHGFILLEQIRKYLMLPNVIVLLSANYEQLEKICYNHYTKVFKHSKKDNKQYIQRLSMEYLEKLVPAQRQIRLLSGRHWRFFEQEPLLIEYDKPVKIEKTQGVDKSSVSDTMPMQGTLCEITQKQMNERFHMKFAPRSKCIRELTPVTIRELYSRVIQINELQALAETNEKQLCIYENNMKWFRLVEFPRISKKYLSLEQQEIFETLDIVDISYQIVWMKENFDENKWPGQMVSLLEMLSLAEKENKKRQEFASVSLIYFTMKLSEAVAKIKWGNQAERDKGAVTLLQYFSKGAWGLWGNWERTMIRPLARILSKEGSNKGKIKFIRIGWSRFSLDDRCLDLEFNETYNGNEIKDIKAFVTSHRPQLIDYQYLLLFYKLDKRKSEHNIWKICNNSKATEIKLNRSYSGTFSLSGFVLNLIEGAALVKEFIECLKEQWVKSSGAKNKEAIDELGNNLSILTQINKGEENSQAMEEPLLPIDSVEFLIYVGEKIQERFENTILEEESPDSIKKQIKDYFEVIEECLKEFDKIYDSNTWYRFNNFPLVKKIMTNNDSFMNLLARSIQCHVVPYDSINEETEWGIDG